MKIKINVELKSELEKDEQSKAIHIKDDWGIPLTEWQQMSLTEKKEVVSDYVNNKFFIDWDWQEVEN